LRLPRHWLHALGVLACSAVVPALGTLAPLEVNAESPAEPKSGTHRPDPGSTKGLGPLRVRVETPHDGAVIASADASVMVAGRVLTPSGALDTFDLVIVIELTLQSLRYANRLAKLLQARNRQMKLHVVANRAMQKPDVTVKEFEAGIDGKLRCVFAQEPKSFAAAAMKGRRCDQAVSAASCSGLGVAPLWRRASASAAVSRSSAICLPERMESGRLTSSTRLPTTRRKRGDLLGKG